MINVKVVIERPSVTDKNRLTYIEMDMDEYIDFIKEQANLLGIREPKKYLTCTDLSKGGDLKINPLPPLYYSPIMEKTISKTVLDESMKGLKNNKNKGGSF